MKSLTLVLGALALALPAHAELPTLTADVGTVATVVPARQLDLVDSQDHLAAFHVGAGVSLDVPRGVLDLDLAYASTGTDHSAHASAFSASLWLRGVEVGARYRWAVRPWFTPYLRVAGGWDWGTLTLLDESQLTQTVGHPEGTALAGVQLAVPLEKGGARAVQFVLDVGAGYTLRPGYRFDAMGPKPPDQKPDDPIARGTIDVGTMPLSGVAYRITLSLRY
jgi:hypothetical protein